MAENPNKISQIQVGTITYDICDATAREEPTIIRSGTSGDAVSIPNNTHTWATSFDNCPEGLSIFFVSGVFSGNATGFRQFYLCCLDLSVEDFATGAGRNRWNTVSGQGLLAGNYFNLSLLRKHATGQPYSYGMCGWQNSGTTLTLSTSLAVLTFPNVPEQLW